MTKKSAKAPASHEVPGSRPHSISFVGVQAKTKQSFRDECDVNKIVDRFTRTGEITHTARIKPQFGDAPDQDFHTAACIAAEAASAIEEGLPGEDDLESPENGSEDASDDVTALAAETGENPLPVPPENDGDGTE